MTVAAGRCDGQGVGVPKRGRNQPLLGAIFHACFGPRIATWVGRPWQISGLETTAFMRCERGVLIPEKRSNGWAL
jgi:hypothetical protein